MAVRHTHVFIKRDTGKMIKSKGVLAPGMGTLMKVICIKKGRT